MTSLPKDDLEAALEHELQKVVPLPAVRTGTALVRAPDPSSEAEQIAAVHRQGIAMREQRISDKRREMAATIASYERVIAGENERHAVEMRQAGCGDRRDEGFRRAGRRGGSAHRRGEPRGAQGAGVSGWANGHHSHAGRWIVQHAL